MGRIAVVLTLALLFITFQNFSNVPLGILKPQISTANARAVSPTDGSADIRKLAPQRPEAEDSDTVIAVPQSGHDLSSVGQDWMARQSKAITGGAEQKILDKMNKRMNRWVNGEGETIKPRQPGSEASAPRTERTTTPGRLTMRPKNVHFSRVNKMDMDLVGDTHLSCQYKGNSVQWDLSRNVVGDVDLNIRHDSRDSANSIHLKYNW